MNVLNLHQIIFAYRKPQSRPTDVTVVITLYNYRDSIEGALESIKAQTMPALNLIVVNDCSKDDSGQVARRWMYRNRTRFQSCLLIENTQNYGLATARNIALGHVDTPYYFALDADNEIYPQALDKLLRACEASGDQAAYSQLEFFDEETDVGLAYFWDPKVFARGNYVDAMALLRTDAVRACGGYALFETAGWEDYDLWCSFIKLGFRATFVPQILCRYRVHKASMLRSETNVDAAGVSAEIVARHPWLQLAG